MIGPHLSRRLSRRQFQVLHQAQKSPQKIHLHPCLLNLQLSVCCQVLNHLCIRRLVIGLRLSPHLSHRQFQAPRQAQKSLRWILSRLCHLDLQQSVCCPVAYHLLSLHQCQALLQAQNPLHQIHLPNLRQSAHYPVANRLLSHLLSQVLHLAVKSLHQIH